MFKAFGKDIRFDPEKVGGSLQHVVTACAVASAAIAGAFLGRAIAFSRDAALSWEFAG